MSASVPRFHLLVQRLPDTETCVKDGLRRSPRAHVRPAAVRSARCGAGGLRWAFPGPGTLGGVPSQPPPGEPAPPDGSLPTSALTGLGERPFGVYVHVPFCATRCGYCDFNTYTADELGSASGFADWLDGLRAELDLGARVLGAGGPVPAARTVFVGGGTPSLLGAERLSAVVSAIRESFGLAPGAEVTTESNPESTSPEFFAGIRAGGFTRVSLGMQSAAPHVLRVLERTHTPGRAAAAAREARAAGFEHVNLDLIYGTPGETDDDLRASLDAVLDAGADHVSAYSLIVEDGTAMARKVRRGELPMPDEDVLADRYEIIVDLLGDAVCARGGGGGAAGFVSVAFA